MECGLTHGIRDTLRVGEEVGLIPPVISLKFCGKHFAELCPGAMHRACTHREGRRRGKEGRGRGFGRCAFRSFATFLPFAFHPSRSLEGFIIKSSTLDGNACPSIIAGIEFPLPDDFLAFDVIRNQVDARSCPSFYHSLPLVGERGSQPEAGKG